MPHWKSLYCDRDRDTRSRDLVVELIEISVFQPKSPWIHQGNFPGEAVASKDFISLGLFFFSKEIFGQNYVFSVRH